MLFFGGKAKKDRRAQIERFKKIFKMQLPEFRQTALAQGKTLKTVYTEEHFFMKTRQATNIITADRIGGGDKTRNVEIEGIKKRDESAETVFNEALAEFISEVGEVERPDPAMKTEVKADPVIMAEAAEAMKKAEEQAPPQQPAVDKAEPGGEAGIQTDKKEPE